MHEEPTDRNEEENDDHPAEDAPVDDMRGFSLVEPGNDENNDDVEHREACEDTSGDDKNDPDENDDGDENGDGENDGPDEDGVTPLPVAAIVEAILFAAREPLKLAQIARAVGKRTRQDAVRSAIDELNVQYLETSRAFEIAEISGRFQLMSRPEYADYIMRIYPKRELADKETKNQRLTPAMLDTLAIVAYKQPVMRSEIEHIRGVACGPALRTLIERGSVREIGRRADLVGKPAVFGTTERFLAEFGLGSIEELPMRNEFVAPGQPPQVEMAAPNLEGDDDASPEDNAATEENGAADETPSGETAVEEPSEADGAEAETSLEEDETMDETMDEAEDELADP